MADIKLFKGWDEEDNKAIKKELKKFGINFTFIPPSMAFSKDIPLIRIKKEGEPPRYIHGKGKIIEFLREKTQTGF